jgi:hypothetical protein
LEPEERRASDLESIADESASKRALLAAEVFVLMTILRLLP